MSVSVRVKLSGLWASTMFCFIYGDYFELYLPGKLQSMLDGRIIPLGDVTHGVLVGTTIMMAIPSVMVSLCLLLRSSIVRWLNIVMGVVYALIMALVIRGTWSFFILVGVVEIALLVSIVYLAWKWPRANDA